MIVNQMLSFWAVLGLVALAFPVHWLIYSIIGEGQVTGIFERER